MPNPFSGVTLLSFNANQPDQYRLKVVNLLGEEVYQTSVKGLSGMNYIRLDASQWSSGVYMYALSNGRNTLTGKLQVIQ